jgi:hypothetical protein
MAAHLLMGQLVAGLVAVTDRLNVLPAQFVR